MASPAVLPAVRQWSDDFHSIFTQWAKNVEAGKVEEKKKEDAEVKKVKKGKKKRSKKDGSQDKKDDAKDKSGLAVPPKVIVATNPSDFTLFAKVRDTVLTNLLAENRRAIRALRAPPADGEESSDEEKTEVEEVTVPKVVGFGICSVFELIKEARVLLPALCAKALSALLDVLQGQVPEGLNTESSKTLESLHGVLIELVTKPVEIENAELGREVQSLACACLLSLVVAWGKTGPLLTALSAVLIAAGQRGDIQLKVPEVLYALQRSVQAACVGYKVAQDWLEVGISTAALVDKWPVYDVAPCDPTTSSLAVERNYAYLFTNEGLSKIGTGHEGTIKGYVYVRNKDFHAGESGWLGCVKGKLYFKAKSSADQKLSIINMETLQEDGTVELDFPGNGKPATMFSDGMNIGHIQSGLTLRLFDTTQSPMRCVKETDLTIASHHVFACGKVQYANNSLLHLCYFDGVQNAVIQAGREFALLLKSNGKLCCIGSSSTLGYPGAASPPDDSGEWAEIAANIKQIAVGHNGTFAAGIDFDNVVHCYGSPYNGEDGTKSAKNRRAVKICSGTTPAKLTSVKVTFVACGCNTSAYVSDKGQLYLFGTWADEFTDAESGVVLGLLGIDVQTVAIGKCHVLAMSKQGVLYSFGVNSRGQCGDGEGLGVAASTAPHDESSSDDDEPVSAMCKAGQHTWGNTVCMICTVCGFCTGYGKGCCNTNHPDREPGTECGCGSGVSGCETCGCCKGCGEDKGWALAPKQSKKKAGKGTKEKKASGKKAFRPTAMLMPVDGGILVEQVAAGHQHSAVLLSNGDVYTFGGNADGQLGNGKKEDSATPVKVDLPGPAKQIAAGGHHTVVLLVDGRVVTFGKPKGDQLGREPVHADPLWHAKPGIVSGPALPDKPASWVGAGASTTYIQVSSSLLTEDNLSRSLVFGNPQCLGIVPDVHDTSESAPALFYDRSSCRLQRLSGQAELHQSMVCYEPSYSLLYRFHAESSQMECFDVFASHSTSPVGAPGQFGSTIFSPELSFPRHGADSIAASQAALHLLACLSNMNTAIAAGTFLKGPGGAKVVPGSCIALGATYAPADVDQKYTTMCRFQSSGGCWGYSNESVDAIRFSCSTDIMLYGIGIYGSSDQSPMTADIQVVDKQPGGGSTIAETSFEATSPLKAHEFSEFHHCLFSKPVRVEADHEYNILVRISTENRSCSGSRGSNTTDAEDEGQTVRFKFQTCSESNNGTDCFSGQIPGILFKVYKEQTLVPVSKPSGQQLTAHVLHPEFSANVTADGFSALLRLMRWSWDNLCLSVRQPIRSGSRRDILGALQDLKRLVFITTRCLQIAETFVLEAYPLPGAKKPSKPEDENLVVVVGDLRVLVTDMLGKSELLSKMSGESADADSPFSLFQQALEQCYKVFVACFHAFYPSILLQWTVLFGLLNQYETQAHPGGVSRCSRHLAAVMEALARPTQPLLETISTLPVGDSKRIYALQGAGDPRYPVLHQHMMERIQEQGECADVASFKDVVTQLLGLVVYPARKLVGLEKDTSEPDNQVAVRAGDLLAALVGQLALDCRVAMEAGPVIQAGKWERGDREVCETPKCYSTTTEQPVSDAMHSACFKVDTDGIMLAGVQVYGAKGIKHCELELHQATSTQVYSLKEIKAAFLPSTFESSNCTRVEFSKPVSIMPGKDYVVAVRLEGAESVDCPYGDGECQESVVTSDGVTFSYSPSPVSNDRSLIAGLLYVNTLLEGGSGKNKEADERKRPSAHLVRLSSLLLESCAEVLAALSDGQPAEEVSAKRTALGSSYIFSTLLPLCLAYLSPVMSFDPQLAVDVISLLKDILPLVASLNRGFTPSESVAVIGSQEPVVESLGSGSDLDVTVSKQDNSSGTESSAGHPALPVVSHHVVVESDHPYKTACCSGYQIGFPAAVRWMLLEFDSRCGTCQVEDSVSIYMSRKTCTGVPGDAIVSMDPQDFWPIMDEVFTGPPGGTWPKRPLVVPGRQLSIWLETASDYAKDNNACKFGFRCTVTGFEWASGPDQVTLVLERELAYLAGSCAVSLMQDDLPIADVSPDTDNIHPTIKQLIAEEEFVAHKDVLQQGLGLNHAPSITEVLHGHIAWQEQCSEQQFLEDLINLAPDTTGGRLARWLQPQLCVDAQKSQLKTVADTIYSRWLQYAFTMTTRDCDGRSLFVENMKVECKAIPANLSKDYPDPALLTGLPTVDFTANYAPTEGLGGKYHSISAMKHYEDFSFEEIRLQAPRAARSSETMDVVSRDDGRYEVTWTPSFCGEYKVEAFVDGVKAGEDVIVVVDEPPSGAVPPPLPFFINNIAKASGKGVNKTREGPRKMRLKLLRRELRIRDSPSLQGKVLGRLTSGTVVEVDRESANDHGRWVALSKASCKEFTSGKKGWVLAFNGLTCETYLEESEGSEEESGDVEKDPIKSAVDPLKAVKQLKNKKAKKKNKSAKAKLPEGGAGDYVLVHCGSLGHNIRRKATTKATPVGLLFRGCKVTAIASVKNKDGLWIRLGDKSVEEFCEAQDESWSLASSSKGVMFLQSVFDAPLEELFGGRVVRRGFKSVDDGEEEEDTESPAELDIPGVEEDDDDDDDDDDDNDDGDDVDVSVSASESGEDEPVGGEMLKYVNHGIIGQAGFGAPIGGPFGAPIGGPFGAPIGGPFGAPIGGPFGAPKPGNVGGLFGAPKPFQPGDIPADGGGLFGAKPFQPGEGPAGGFSFGAGQPEDQNMVPMFDVPAAAGGGGGGGNQMAFGGGGVGFNFGGAPAPQVQQQQLLQQQQQQQQQQQAPLGFGGFNFGGPPQASLDNDIHCKEPWASDSDDSSADGGAKQAAGIGDLAAAAVASAAAATAATAAADAVSTDSGGTYGLNMLFGGDEDSEKEKKSASTAGVSARGKKKAASQTGGGGGSEKSIGDKRYSKQTGLSPAVAECLRTVLAAFLWHGSLVHDAMASSAYLKFHPELTRETGQPSSPATAAIGGCAGVDSAGNEGEATPTLSVTDNEGSVQAEANTEDHSAVATATATTAEKLKRMRPSLSADGTTADSADSAVSSQHLPPTLRYLVRVFQQLTEAVLQSLNRGERRGAWVSPVPSTVTNLIAQVEKEARAKKEDDEKVRRKAARDGGGGGNGDRTDLCELCDEHFQSPVTYHMREVHPGCGKHAQGKGYNSQGRHYGGWAGNCGDGGRGGSTWYLMCDACRTKYLDGKAELKKAEKQSNSRPEPKVLPSRGELKSRTLQSQPSYKMLTDNARFLLRLAPHSDKPSLVPAVQDSEDANSTRSRQMHFQKMKSQPASSTAAAGGDEGSSAKSHGRLLKRKLSTSSSGRESELDFMPAYHRSVSFATEDTRPGDAMAEPMTLLHKPSHQLSKLVAAINRADRQNLLLESPVLKFVSQPHDLLSLHWCMEHCTQLAACRQHALATFEWILRSLSNPSVLHDILWMFSGSLQATGGSSESHPKAEGEATQQLGSHPLVSLLCCGQTVMQPVRTAFHSFLTSVTELLTAVPCGSVVQQAAIRCLALQFHPDDHAFLHKGQVFSTISNVLAKLDEEAASQTAEPATEQGSAPVGKVFLLENVLAQCELKMSSRQAMANSLQDGDTETFWESGDGDQAGSKNFQITCGNSVKARVVCVHIDNSRDNGHRVKKLSMSVGDVPEALKSKDHEAIVGSNFAGWLNIPMPPEHPGPKVIQVTLTGVHQAVRLRQVALLGTSDETPERTVTSELPSRLAHSQACQAEALHVFRQLTSQVFGRLLSGEQKEDAEAEIKAAEDSSDLREQVVGILFSEGKPLTQLQKQVCEQMVRSLCAESARLRSLWTASLSGKNADGNPPAVKVENGKMADSYCMEILSMLLALSGSASGASYMAQQFELLEALVTLLHTSEDAVQFEVLKVLSHVMGHVAPSQFAYLLGGASIPPAGYSAIMHAQHLASGQLVAPSNSEVLDIFLACISKSLSVQVRVKGGSSNAGSAESGVLGALGGKGVSTVTSSMLLHSDQSKAQNQIRRWYMCGNVSNDVAQAVIRFLRDMCEGKMGAEWSTVCKAAIAKLILSLTAIGDPLRTALPCMMSHQAWLAFASLCVLSEEHIESLSSGKWHDKPGGDQQPQAAGSKPKPTCDNHDDGQTRAIVQCNECGSLCGECDRVLHLPKRCKSHQRQVFKEEEEAIKVEVHEGCGRVKLYWLMALADPKALRAMVEFRDIQAGVGSGGSGPCRFCGSGASTALLPIGSVCTDPDCQDRARKVCNKTLDCSHPCGGVLGEEKCLPCLHGCTAQSSGGSNGAGHDSTDGEEAPVLRQDADDMCIICYSEPLSAAPAVQLSCGHVYHKHCCDSQIEKRWAGPRIAFRFLMCPICENRFIKHPLLAATIKPMMDLYEEVKRKSLMRLEYENRMKHEAITSAASKFYQQPAQYAMNRYAYYVCVKCSKAYFGGEALCAVQAGMSLDFDPSELVCGACSNIEGAQVCPKHGTDFLEYKCRYCCSVAVYFCFGTTHFCTPCHDDFQRLGNMDKNLLPSCPVGPTAVPLDVQECPLRVAHPPTGEEFALGCGVCRNAQTF